jgi:hypothetical protein
MRYLLHLFIIAKKPIPVSGADKFAGDAIRDSCQRIF